ncbi:MAG: tRNA (adenosine(37)-N6)-threonylcarbamoyltransferase complex dimerization subunit type 1 TsaB [Desulfovibrionaceae bacterium CG1_02_65_16]|nr:MAG: tRNA (adenosine(37)-N6)-threonylcarbamoyltransferase complex dimerization subunit type 1 TsaB [Desulfovibrionaceae bacterium CG1_02_65_16]
MLAINGADERLQMAIGSMHGGTEGGTGEAVLLAAQEWTVPGQAMRFLAPGIRHMLDGLGAHAADIRRIACVTGPGSFTGLRMSLALAEGLAAGNGAQLAGIGHLELLAREAAQTAPGDALALVWSRRGQVYAQAFARESALTPPEVIMLEAMPAYLARLPRPLVMLGGGLRRNLAFFAPLAAADADLRLLPRVWDAPRPQSLLELAAAALYGPGPLAPVYLRVSDAEDNLAAIAAGRGLSEAEAQTILARGSLTLR